MVAGNQHRLSGLFEMAGHIGWSWSRVGPWYFSSEVKAQDEVDLDDVSSLGTLLFGSRF